MLFLSVGAPLCRGGDPSPGAAPRAQRAVPQPTGTNELGSFQGCQSDFANPSGRELASPTERVEKMKRNIGKSERAVRGLAAAGLLSCSVMSPLPLPVRLAAFGATGLYVLFTALSGTCLGYALLGKSTCPAEPRQ